MLVMKLCDEHVLVSFLCYCGEHLRSSEGSLKYGQSYMPSSIFSLRLQRWDFVKAYKWQQAKVE